MSTPANQPKEQSTPDDPFKNLLDWPFNHSMRVRWAEADIQGVVFNGNYLTYFDVGITEYLRAVLDNNNDRLHQVFDSLYVVKTTMEYAAPAHFDELIDVAVRTSRMGNTSLTFEFQIFRDGVPLVSCQNVYVHAPKGVSQPIPDSLRQAITLFDENKRD